MTGRVDEVELVLGPGQGYGGRRDGDPAVTLLVVHLYYFKKSV